MQNAFIERARHARERVLAVKQDATAAEKYLTAVRGLPAEIRLVGLGQALATLRSRSEGRETEKDGNRRLYRDVEHWVLDGNPIKIFPTSSENPRLLHAIVAGDNSKYRLAVAEIDGYLAVLKRLAEIFLSDDPNPSGAAPQ
jgi:CRISPR type III-B/RAMP module-associated protein Cmr5